MPIQYNPDRKDIEPPKEAKSHASFRVVVAVSDYLERTDQQMEDALLNPSRKSLGNCVVILRGLWRRVLTIMEKETVDRVDTAFKEFALWFNRYTTHPSRRSRKPFYHDSLIQVECNKRLEDIYRTITEGLQNKQFLFKIEERGKQDLKSRMQLIEAHIYGDRRKLPKAGEPKKLQTIPGSNDAV